MAESYMTMVFPLDRIYMFAHESPLPFSFTLAPVVALLEQKAALQVMSIRHESSTDGREGTHSESD